MTARQRAEAKWTAAKIWRRTAPRGYRQTAQARLYEATRELLRRELRGRR